MAMPPRDPMTGQFISTGANTTRNTHVDWHGHRVVNEVRDVMVRRLVLAALIVEGRAKMSMSRPKTGLVYLKSPTRARYTASAPGEAPAVRTSRLQGSVTHDEVEFKKGGKVASIRVGTNVKDAETNFSYPRALELGTGRMAPRPWLRPALDESKDEIQALFAM